eukprot:TRINITY_DN6560_c0_g1_i4.p1 TRINITY_DN6560_c0_g1~~TRINITY_DN6560_c0_g1_i4.p1  ORF type:complete len:175 (+),score=67.55 TRINITY_DN6560_c0_g1_i4:200-724(+)
MQAVSSRVENGERIIVFPGVQYLHRRGELKQMIDEKGWKEDRFVLADVDRERLGQPSEMENEKQIENGDGSDDKKVDGEDDGKDEENDGLNVHVIGRRKVVLGEGLKLEDYGVLYVGQPGRALTNLAMNNSTMLIESYNESSGEIERLGIRPSKMIMKRYFMVEAAKNADIIGA